MKITLTSTDGTVIKEINLTKMLTDKRANPDNDEFPIYRLKRIVKYDAFDELADFLEDWENGTL